MNTFAQATLEQSAQTLNGAEAYASTLSAAVDLFSKIGSPAGQNLIAEFSKAYVENPDVALRILQWGRDIRQGAGQREVFRGILKHLEATNTDAAKSLANKVSVLGRWDDLLIFESEEMKTYAFELIARGLADKNTSGLCAKWMPRKGKVAVELRQFLKLSPKGYRKTLVKLTNVVETKMCAKDWSNIEFDKVPSLAFTRYKKAFTRNASDSFSKFLEKVEKGEAKISAGAVYPHQVIKDFIVGYYASEASKDEIKAAILQWDALPNYLPEDIAILPMVDVSGSMTTTVQGNTNALQVAIGLGLYLADKNKGKFNGMFSTFSSTPKIEKLTGDIYQKTCQMSKSHWNMSTDIGKAFDEILEVAVRGNVPANEMPKYLLILSDMQFNPMSVSGYSVTSMKYAKDRFEKAGYTLPKIIYWNIVGSYDNYPVRSDDLGTALVSGYSPAILKAILSDKLQKFTPENVMLETVMIDRYAL